MPLSLFSPIPGNGVALTSRFSPRILEDVLDAVYPLSVPLLWKGDDPAEDCLFVSRRVSRGLIEKRAGRRWRGGNEIHFVIFLLMSDFTPLSDANPQTVSVPPPAADVGDAVWRYLVSVKSVKKRGGQEELFQVEKLRHSVESALGNGYQRERTLTDRVVRHALMRLTRRFDGHTVPASADIREVVHLTLLDHNLAHAARRYAGVRVGEAQKRASEPQYGSGIRVERHFTTPGIHPYDRLVWERRDARITNEKGKVVFEQKGVEVPVFWSQSATNIVVSKYFHGQVGLPDRETSVRQLVDRVAKTLADWGRKDGYFQTSEDADAFEAELTHLLVNQMAAFNSPVWFNVGIEPTPQCSACFINSVQDDMHSILNLVVTEGMLFKGGSGTGSNLSTLRSSKEYLAGSNGRASGPVSFMKGLDAFAGVIKSGGKTRRAAKMVILNIDHPDIESFIKCKVEEEKKAWALMDAGYDGSIDGSAYSSIFFQNANNSVRVTDDFMHAVAEDREWTTREVTTGKPSVAYKARDLFRMMAEAAWQCGDPGIQYDTAVNRWHTCKRSGRINGSNPCSEFMFLDDSACNLASINLMKFRKISSVLGGTEEKSLAEFDTKGFKKANEILTTAMEIIVGNSSYPTPAIEENSLVYRPLGIGYANLGALLMSRGLPYDSDEGRNLAAAITALQTGSSYAQSAKIAEHTGPFPGFAENADSCLSVLNMHREASEHISAAGVPADLLSEARQAWEEAMEGARSHGVRNAQISLLAPTGTIAFLMDCDTTGVEPDIALVKYKWLVGGGLMKIVNQTVPEALRRLGYPETEVKEILEYVDREDTIEGAPYLKEEDLPVFDCAFKPARGKRTIHHMGHLRMMAAVQPFLSGAISKTVNMPNEATTEDVMNVYAEGWKMGLKSVAIYRDGSKRQQALTTSTEKDASKSIKKSVAPEAAGDGRTAARPIRRRLPDERRSVTHKFSVGDHKGYITVGLYDDGTAGELFIRMAKEGSVISGLMDSFSTAVSIGLQYGVPLPVLVNKFVHVRFEPYGYTSNPQIRIAKSIVDYIFRWMALKFLSQDQQQAVGIHALPESAGDPLPEPPLTSVSSEAAPQQQVPLFDHEGTGRLTATFDNQSDAPACSSCGSMMVRNGSCYKCLNCGSTSGCS